MLRAYSKDSKQKTLYTSLNTWNDVEDSFVRERETLSTRSL